MLPLLWLPLLLGLAGQACAAGDPELEPTAAKGRRAESSSQRPLPAVRRAAEELLASRPAGASAGDAAGSAPVRRAAAWDRLYTDCNVTNATYGAVVGTPQIAKQWHSGFWKQGDDPFGVASVMIAASITMNKSHLYGEVGNQYLKAYDLYMHMLADEVGVLNIGGQGRPVELMIVDDFSDVAQTAGAYQALAQCLTRLFLGPYSSTLTFPAARVAQEAGAVMVAAGASNTDVFVDRSRVFGISVPGHKCLPPALEALAERGARTLAYVFEDSQGPRSMCTGADEFSRQRGLSLLYKQEVSRTNLRDSVTRLVQLQPDVVVGCMYVDLCYELIEEARRQNLNPKAFVMPICAPNPFFLEETNYAGQYMIGLKPRPPLFPLAPGLRRIETEELIARWKAHHATLAEPTYQAIEAFSGISALVLAIQYANSTDPDAIITALHNLSELTFDHNRQRVGSLDAVQYVFHDSKYKSIAPPEVANADIWYPRPKWQDLLCFDMRPQDRYHHIGIATNSTDLECRLCPEGTVSKFEGKMRTCEECGPGQELRKIWRNGNLHEASCIDCTPGMMAHRGACVFCPAGKFQNLSTQTACIDCLPGRFSRSVASTACTSCEVTSELSTGTFYSTQAGSTECLTCPTGGLCERQANGLFTSITNKDGYYVMPAAPREKVYWCPHGHGRACLSHGRCYQDENGEVTMEGLLCGKCRKGYGRTEDWYGLCAKCSDGPRMIRSVLFNMMALVTMVGVLMYMVATLEFSNPQQLHLVITRQFLSYIQMAVIVTDTRSAMAPRFLSKSLKEGTGYLTGQSGLSIYMVSCFATSAFPDVEFFKVAQIFGLCIVPAAMLISFVGFLILRCVLALVRVERPSWRWLATLIVVFLYVTYPRVVEWNLASLMCHSFDGVERLVVDPAVRCGAPEHLIWRVAAVLGLVFYTFGIPLVFYLAILYCRRKGLIQRAKMEMLHFLTIGFEHHYWYFECIFFVRKVCYTFVPRLPGMSAEDPEAAEKIRNVMLLVVSALFLTLQLCCKPFDKRGCYILNRIETASLVAVSMTPLMYMILWQAESAGSPRSSSTAWQPLGGRVAHTTCVVITALCHCRVLLLVLWGLTRNWAVTLAPRPRAAVTDKPGWPARLLSCFVPRGTATLIDEGIQFQGVAGTCEAMLEDILEDIVKFHIGYSGTLTYQGLTNSLKRIMAEAQRQRDEEGQRKPSPIGSCVRWFKKTVDGLPMGAKFARGMLVSVEESLRKRGWIRSSRFSSGGPGGRDRQKVHMVKQQEGELTSVSAFVQGTSAPERLSRARGQVFSIEEMQEALMRLCANAYQEFYPVYEEDASPGGDGGAFGRVVAKRTSCVSEGFSSVLSDGSAEIDESRIDELEEEIAKTREEGKALQAAVNDEFEESCRLLQVLQGLETRLADLGPFAPSDGVASEAELDRTALDLQAAAQQLLSGCLRAEGEPEATAEAAEAELAPRAAAGEADAQDESPLGAEASGDSDDSSDSELQTIDEEESPWRMKMMQEERRALAKERDSAVISCERLELELHKSQLRLRELRAEVAAETEQINEGEMKLALAEAENASLHRWAAVVMKDQNAQEAAHQESSQGSSEQANEVFPAEPRREDDSPPPQARLRNDFLGTCKAKERRPSEFI